MDSWAPAVWLQAMDAESTSCEPVPMDSEDTLFMLYTSGSTGKPKGITHSVAGYLLYTAVTFKVKTLAQNSGYVLGGTMA